MNEKICCYPRIRAEYDKTYTFGFDRNVKNFKNCGKVYYQRLPPIGPPMADLICRRNYYDEECVECNKPINSTIENDKELSKENFVIYYNK